jgi:hypothetical protein
LWWLWREARPRNRQSRRADREDFRRRTVSAAALSDTGAGAELRERTDLARTTVDRSAKCVSRSGEYSAAAREHPADEWSGEHSAEHVSSAR